MKVILGIEVPSNAEAREASSVKPGDWLFIWGRLACVHVKTGHGGLVTIGATLYIDKLGWPIAQQMEPGTLVITVPAPEKGGSGAY